MRLPDTHSLLVACGMRLPGTHSLLVVLNRPMPVTPLLHLVLLLHALNRPMPVTPLLAFGAITPTPARANALSGAWAGLCQSQPLLPWMPCRQLLK